MQDITISIELIQKSIQESLPTILKDKLSSSYSSPISKIVDEALKKEEGAISTFVSGLISDALSNQKFKEELGKAVLSKFIEVGLKNR